MTRGLCHHQGDTGRLIPTPQMGPWCPDAVTGVVFLNPPGCAHLILWHFGPLTYDVCNLRPFHFCLENFPFYNWDRFPLSKAQGQDWMPPFAESLSDPPGQKRPFRSKGSWGGLRVAGAPVRLWNQKTGSQFSGPDPYQGPGLIPASCSCDLSPSWWLTSCHGSGSQQASLLAISRQRAHCFLLQVSHSRKTFQELPATFPYAALVQAGHTLTEAQPRGWAAWGGPGNQAAFAGGSRDGSGWAGTGPPCRPFTQDHYPPQDWQHYLPGAQSTGHVTMDTGGTCTRVCHRPSQTAVRVLAHEGPAGRASANTGQGNAIVCCRSFVVDATMFSRTVGQTDRQCASPALPPVAVDAGGTGATWNSLPARNTLKGTRFSALGCVVWGLLLEWRRQTVGCRPALFPRLASQAADRAAQTPPRDCKPECPGLEKHTCQNARP